MNPPQDQPTGGLAFFDWLAMATFLSALVWAAWTGERAIALVTALLVISAALARFWSRFSLAGVSYERVLSECRAFPGEELDLIVRLTNRKPLPAAWLQVEDQLPAPLRPESPSWLPSIEPQAGVLVHVASLLWYRRTSWRYRLPCRRRGCFSLGPAILRGGDPFGFFPHAKTLPLSAEVIVYPRLLPVAQVGFVAHQPLGDLRADRTIFEDPSRAIGIRDYRSTDALKRIHWKASARRQQLQVRVYEPTTTVQSMLVFGLEGYGAGEPADEERFEYAVSAVASLANHGIAQRQAVGLLVNGGLIGGHSSILLRPAAGADDLTGILEVLARLAPIASLPLADVLLQQSPSIPWGATINVLAGAVDDRLIETLRQLQRQGRRVTVCSLGDGTPVPARLGIPVQQLILGAA